MISRPAILMFPQLTSMLVREGHLMQAHGFQRKLDAALLEVLGKSWQRRQVTEMPAGSLGWLRTNHLMWKECSADLSPDDVTEAMSRSL